MGYTGFSAKKILRAFSACEAGSARSGLVRKAGIGHETSLGRLPVFRKKLFAEIVRSYSDARCFREFCRESSWPRSSAEAGQDGGGRSINRFRYKSAGRRWRCSAGGTKRPGGGMREPHESAVRQGAALAGGEFDGLATLRRSGASARRPDVESSR